MAAWRDGIAYKLEATFGDDPFEASPTWTDLSAYLCPWSLDFGRSSESNEFSPSVLQFQLRNDDRRFDPDHVSGPYFGDLVPMVRVRLTVTYSAVDRVLFDGYVLGWPQEWGRKIGNVTVVATDGTRPTENAPLAASAYAVEVNTDTPDHYWPMQDVDLLDEVGELNLSSSSLGFVDDGSETTLDPTTVDRVYPLGQSESWWGKATGEAPASLPLTIEAWVHRSFYTSSNSPSITIELPFTTGNRNVWLINYVETVDQDVQIFYSNAVESKRHSTATETGVGIEPGRRVNKFARHVVATIDATYTTIKLYIDGREVYSASLAAGTDTATFQTPSIEISGNTAGNSADLSSLAHVALYDSELSAARVTAHFEAGLHAFGHPIGERSGERIGRVLDEIGWPTARRSLDTGSSVQGPYLPNGEQSLDYIRQVEASEQGLFFFSRSGDATFIDREALAADADSGKTFSDDGTSGDIGVAEVRPDGNSITTIRNLVTVSWREGAITRKDAASKTKYLEQRESIESPSLPTAEAASSLAAYVLRLRKDPLTRVTELEVDIREDPTDHIAVLDLDIGAVADFEWTPMNVGSAVSKRLMVQGGRIWSNDEEFKARLYLSPAAPSTSEAGYLTLNDVTYGEIGATAGNIILA